MGREDFGQGSKKEEIKDGDVLVNGESIIKEDNKNELLEKIKKQNELFNNICSEIYKKYEDLTNVIIEKEFRKLELENPSEYESFWKNIEQSDYIRPIAGNLFKEINIEQLSKQEVLESIRDISATDIQFRKAERKNPNDKIVICDSSMAGSFDEMPYAIPEKSKIITMILDVGNTRKAEKGKIKTYDEVMEEFNKLNVEPCTAEELLQFVRDAYYVVDNDGMETEYMINALGTTWIENNQLSSLVYEFNGGRDIAKWPLYNGGSRECNGPFLVKPKNKLEK